MKSLRNSYRDFWLDPQIVSQHHLDQLKGFAPLEGKETCDVCVIGGGISGLSAALALAKEGSDVVLLEAHSLGGGQTARTTAHLSDFPDTGFEMLLSHHGLDNTRHVAAALRQAIRKIEENINSGPFSCDFQSLNGYLSSGRSPGEQRLYAEFNAMEKIGVHEMSQQVGQSILPGISDFHLRLEGQAQFNPLLYLMSLAHQLRGLGARIYCHTRAESIQGGQAVKVKTSRQDNQNALGQSPKTSNLGVVTARFVIVATNTPINDRFVIHTKQAPYTTYAVTARIPSGTVEPGLYWDCEQPFHYVRTFEQGAAGDRDGDYYLIIGGADHKSGQEPHPLKHVAKLKQWARKAFPGIVSDFSHQWSGQVLMTVDGLPFCGVDPSENGNVLITTGYSGLGMTFGIVAAEVLRDAIIGNENPLIDILKPSRKVITALPAYVSENINAIAQFRHFLDPSQDRGAMGVGEGMITRQGVKRIGIYRDETGNEHQFHAVCPHLGAPLEWNAFEKAWDCPLHGSKFGAMGEVINGPANCPLRRVAAQSTGPQTLEIREKTQGEIREKTQGLRSLW